MVARRRRRPGRGAESLPELPGAPSPPGSTGSSGSGRPPDRSGSSDFPGLRLRCGFPRLLAVPVLAAFVLSASPAFGLRVVSYNLLNYPGSTGSARAPHYRTILGPLQADIIVCQEVHAGGPTQFLDQVLDVLEPGQWETVPFVDGNDSDATIFYRSALVDTVWQWAFYPNPSNPLRLVHAYRLKLVDYSSPTSELRIYTAHLKASTGFETQRLLECIGLRDSLNAMPIGTRALLCGDLNFYTQNSEPGYAKLLENQPNNIGRLFDLLPAGDWHDGGAFAPYHTQSTCKDGTCASGAATGGLDDRFDFILPTYSLLPGQGMSVLPNTCHAVGNDGRHLNLNITDPPTIPEGAAYATALKLASDHLPLRVDLQLPARLAVQPQLAFDAVIVGAPTQSRELFVENRAAPPADSLDCILTTPAGFGAPADLAVAAGTSFPAMITMEAGTVGYKSGDLLLVSDAPDQPITAVALSGSVLDHAVASLDSASLSLAGAVDFGDHEAGGFDWQAVRIHNLGYHPLQARLALLGAEIAGGSHRFSLAEPFHEGLLAETGRTFFLAFDDVGASPDSTYWATLAFTSADEPLPGAAPQPDLRVTLRACVIGGTAAIPGSPETIAARLHPASPNPLADRTSLLLELAEAGPARLAVYDASGRLVRSLWDGHLNAGRHPYVWDARDDHGASVGSGVYFARAVAPGARTMSTGLVIVR